MTTISNPAFGVRHADGLARPDAPWLSRPAIYATFLVATLLVRGPSWSITLINPDEYAFILAAREILHGHLPFTTLFDIKPAGVSTLLACAMALLGQSLLAVRIFGAACVLASAILISEAARLPAPGRMVQAGAGILYIAFSALLGGCATMAEIMLAPFSCLGFLLLARVLTRPVAGRAAWATMFGAGLAFGLAIWVKTVPVAPALAVGGAVLLYGAVFMRVSLPDSLARAVLFAAGLSLPVLVTALVFYSAGSFADFSYATFGFMGSYVAPTPVKYMILHAATIAAALWPLLALAAAGACLDGADLLGHRRIGPGIALAYVWLFAEIVAAAGPLRLYDHYFLMVVPPLAMLASRVVTRATPGSASVSIAALVVVALIPVVPLIRQDALDVLKFPDSQRTTSAAIDRLLPPADRSLLVLSYDYQADYFFTHTPMPGRISIAAHLFNQSDLVSTDPVAPVQAVLDRNPALILVDFTYLGQMATDGQRAAVNRKLACCYADAANLGEFWRLAEGGDFHVADLHVFRRK